MSGASSRRALRSMTGFASVDGVAGQGTGFTLTLKCVNHRFLDLSFRLPSRCEGLETRLRARLKDAVRRGHVDVTLQVGRQSGSDVEVNAALVGTYVEAFRRAAMTHGLAGEPDLNAILRMPGVMVVAGPGAGEADGALEAAVMAEVETLMEALNGVREREGATLGAELRAVMGRLGECVEQVTGARVGMRERHFEALRLRIGDLLKDTAVNEERLLMEAGVLVERGDVDEELVRLRTHVGTFVALLDEGGEVGKRLDFLLQELGREANTVLSKTGGGAGSDGLRITDLGLAMKMEIERAREQVQNLE